MNSPQRQRQRKPTPSNSQNQGSASPTMTQAQLRFLDFEDYLAYKDRAIEEKRPCSR